MNKAEEFSTKFRALLKEYFPDRDYILAVFGEEDVIIDASHCVVCMKERIGEAIIQLGIKHDVEMGHLKVQ